jgi:hypothetical protein
MNIPGIAEVLVYGGDTGEQNEVTAVVYPNFTYFESAGYSLQDTAENKEKIREYLLSEIEKVNATLPIYKQVISVKLRTVPFETTTTNKVKLNTENTREF